MRLVVDEAPDQRTKILLITSHSTSQYCEFRSDLGCAQLRHGPHQPNTFHLPMTSHSKVNSHDSTSAPFGQPVVCSNHTASADPSTNYEPHTCPHSKIINQPTLNLLYHSTSLICISLHIREAPKGHMDPSRYRSQMYPLRM
jgi:hypothetical protein